MTFSSCFRPLLLAAWGAGAVLAAAPSGALAQQTQQVINPEARFAEGVRLYGRGLYGPAQTAFDDYLREPAVRMEPERAADAAYYAAVSGLRQLQPDAEGCILAFADRFPAHPKAALAYFELGRFYFEKKDYERAIPNLQQVAPSLLTTSERAESDFKLGYALFQTKQFDKARLLFDRTKTGTHAYVAPSRYYAGFLAFKANDLTTARADLEEAAKNDAYRSQVPQLLTQILYREKNLSEVIRYGQTALAQKPTVAGADEIQLLVGDSYFQQEDYPKAFPLLTAAAGKPGVRGPQGRAEAALEYKTGYAAYKTGDFKAAVQRLQPVAAVRDTLGQLAAYHLGLSYLRVDGGNKPFALTAFEQARTPLFDPKIAEQATIKVAEINFEQGNTRAVIAALADFNKAFPKSKLGDTADDLLSEAYLSSNDYPAAIRHIENLSRRSNKIDRTYQRVTYYEAVNQYNAGKPEAALPLLDKSLATPVDPEMKTAANFLKGESLSLLRRWDEAATAYNNTFRVTPTAGQQDLYRLSRYGLGYAYFNAQKYTDAQVPFTAFLADSASREGDPNLTDARLRLADCYYIAKDYPQALSLYDKVLAVSGPDQDQALFQKGVVLGLTGRRDDALRTLGEIPKRFPQSRLLDNAQFQQAQLEFEAGRFAEAVRGFSSLIQNQPTSALVPQAYHKRGVAYANQQQYEPAVADFKKVLDDYATSPVADAAIFSLQEALTAGGRPEEFDPFLQAYRVRNPDAKSLQSVEYEAAKSLYFAEKYELTVPKFEAYLRQYPNAAVAPDARYYIADSYLRGGDKKAGTAKMREVLSEGRTQFLNKALNRVADLALEEKDYPTAIQYYTRLATAATSRRESSNAQLGLLRATFASADYNRSRQLATDLLAAGNATLNATNSALLIRAKSSLGLGQYAQGIQELRATTAAASDENGAEAQYLLAEAQFQQKNYKEALAEAFKINQTYGAYQRWVGFTFLLLADVYAAQGEVYQAKGTLESLINGKFPLADIVAEARRKLANLEAAGKTDGSADADGNNSNANPSGKSRRAKSDAGDPPAPADGK
ncbi:MAG: tetratricopeptide repeat protein [Hymenobacteraceae bacterium]|nr:tetratricopeptide repeat protein [Hymenobacteraceae bacterium]